MGIWCILTMFAYTGALRARGPERPLCGSNVMRTVHYQSYGQLFWRNVLMATNPTLLFTDLFFHQSIFILNRSLITGTYF